ncbi:SH3 domain-containing protein [Mesorhizobium sp. ANAO-SY3R2]|uniref:SH3 domain-containing protein n=1 Tax=Mesorhizobium sp. ANAO-SY3R2 TaxID=3166644 RepID=UPI00366B6B33
MSGFALPKLRWLVLGALAAGAWAMTQEVPNKARLDDRPARTAHRPRPETAPRTEAAIARPKANVAPRPDVAVTRPKVDIEPAKLAKVTPRPVAAAQKPIAVTKATPRTNSEGGPRKPSAEIATASISQAPTPAPRPKAGTPEAPAKRTATNTTSDAVPHLNVLYTSTSVYLRQRPNAAAPVIHSLKQGESVRIFARDGKWTLVSASGRKGWLQDNTLRPADPTAPRPKEVLAEPARPASPG